MRKLSIIAIVLACVLGIGMIGTGIATAAGVGWNWSGAATVSVSDGDIVKSIFYTSTGSWSGDTWNLGTVDPKTTHNTRIAIENTYSQSVTVKATAVVTGSSGITATWQYFDGSAYVALPTGGITLSAAAVVDLELVVVVPSGAAGGPSSIAIGITAD